jgi:hypothetical protein
VTPEKRAHDYCCGAFVIGNCPNHPPDPPAAPPVTKHPALAAIDKYLTTFHLDGPWDEGMTPEEIERETIKDVRSVVFVALRDHVPATSEPNAEPVCGVEFRTARSSSNGGVNIWRCKLPKAHAGQHDSWTEPKPADPQPEARHAFVVGGTGQWCFAILRYAELNEAGIPRPILCGKPALDPAHLPAPQEER